MESFINSNGNSYSEVKSCWGDKLKAIAVAQAISDENIKRGVLKAIEGEENVGHK